MTTRPGPEDLLGAAEIGRLLGGLSRQRVQQLVSDEDFPKPIARLDKGKIWWRADVERWATENRPPSALARQPAAGDGQPPVRQAATGPDS